MYSVAFSVLLTLKRGNSGFTEGFLGGANFLAMVSDVLISIHSISSSVWPSKSYPGENPCKDPQGSWQDPLRILLRILARILKDPVTGSLRILEDPLRILWRSLRILKDPLRILWRSLRILPRSLRILWRSSRILPRSLRILWRSLRILWQDP